MFPSGFGQNERTSRWGWIWGSWFPSQVRTLARTDEARGLLWLMEEEAVQPGGSEETMLDRLFSYYGAAHGDNKGEQQACESWMAVLRTSRLDSFWCLEWVAALIPLCSRSHSAAARRDAPQLPAGPQPRNWLGGVQRSGLAEPCQAQSRCPERCLSAAGLPEVRTCSHCNHTSSFFSSTIWSASQLWLRRPKTKNI